MRKLNLKNLFVQYKGIDFFFTNREHDFNNDTKLDGLEIFSAIKHSDLASDLKVDTTNMDPIQARKAHEKEINYYAGKSLL